LHTRPCEHGALPGRLWSRGLGPRRPGIRCSAGACAGRRLPKRGHGSSGGSRFEGGHAALERFESSRDARDHFHSAFERPEPLLDAAEALGRPVGALVPLLARACRQRGHDERHGAGANPAPGARDGVFACHPSSYFFSTWRTRSDMSTGAPTSGPPVRSPPTSVTVIGTPRSGALAGSSMSSHQCAVTVHARVLTVSPVGVSV